MEIDIKNITAKLFKTFAEKYDFHQRNEISEDQTYSIEYASSVFVIKLEKYRCEIYATLYKTGNADSEIELFNLLAYLALPSLKAPKSEYFRKEVNYEVGYQKQLVYIVSTIEKYIEEINSFFSTGDYASKFAEVRKYIIKKHPELFRTINDP